MRQTAKMFLIGNAAVKVDDDLTTIPDFGRCRLLAPGATADDGEVEFETVVGRFAFKASQPAKAHEHASRLKSWWDGEWKFYTISVQIGGGEPVVQEGIPSDLPAGMFDLAVSRLLVKAKKAQRDYQVQLENLLAA